MTKYLRYFYYLFYNNKKKIDLLKIDVEGEELNVLKSINLNSHQLRLISIEIHNQYSFIFNRKF